VRPDAVRRRRQAAARQDAPRPRADALRVGHPDPTLATATIFLMAIGLIFVYSAGIMRAEIAYNSTSHFLVRQMVAAAIGIGLMMFVSRVSSDWLENFTGVFGIVTLVLLMVVLIPGIGVKIAGARRWINLGPLGRFQPSEFARLAAVLLVAKYAARHGDEIRSAAGIAKALVLPFVFAALILAEPDTDTGFTVLIIAGVILFAAGIPWLYILSLGALGLVGGTAVIMMAAYRMERILGFLNPYADMRGRGYHIVQGWTAMGSGGFFGKGLGASVLKFGFLPEAHTDFILAIIGEEGGFITTSLIAVLFGVIVWRGYKIALAQSDAYSRFVAVGITAMVTLQALLNMMVVTGLAPTTGVPLPFVSYGGTSVMFMAASLGILLGLSRGMPSDATS